VSLGGVFEAVINPELDPGICDRLSLLEGYVAEAVMARRGGA
jgi:hypothetical protein